MMPWNVVFFDLRPDENAFDELADNLTDKQVAQLDRQFQRLEKHGTDLPWHYFGKIRGSSRGLWELRFSVDNAEIRFLYVLEERTFVVMKGFKHQSDRDVQRHLPTAEHRLDEWRQLQ